MVIIFSVKHDWSTSCIIHWLNSWNVEVVRINGDDSVYKFERLSKEGIYFRNTITGRIINLKEASACWWRRTGLKINHLTTYPKKEQLLVDDFDLTSLLNGGYQLEEAKALIEYIFSSIYQSCPINLGKPLFNLNRLIILDMAEKFGLQIPEYEIITKGQQLLHNDLGPVVSKAIANGIYYGTKKHRFYSYTELIDDDFYRENASNTFFPSLITSLIKKQLEIRSFYLDGKFYSMAIFSQSSEKTKIDFRKYSDNRNVPYQLPEAIEQKLDRMFKKLELNCGSVDLIVNDQGNYVFLEINPVGQFAMTSEPCNYNLERIVANYLRYGNGAN